MANKGDCMTEDEYKALTERSAKAWVSVIDADIAELRDGGTGKAVAAPLDQLSQFGELQKALERIAELESQLESIGAGGVTRLVAQANAEPVEPTNPDILNLKCESSDTSEASIRSRYQQPAIAPAPLPDRYVWEQFYLSDCGMCWGDRQSAYNPTLPEYRECHEGINWHNVNEVRNFRPLYATPQPAITAAHLRMLEDYLLAAQIAEGYRPDECPPLTMPLAGAVYAKLQPAIAPAPLSLTDVDSIAERFAASYASPHHFVMSVVGLRDAAAEIEKQRSQP